MSFLDEVTPVVLTYNEAENIERTLAGLTWAEDIVVVDSFSSDRTLDLIQAMPQTRVLQRRFDSHAQQWNFAIGETGIGTEWVLALDADYIVTPAFVEELRSLRPEPACQGYTADFRYCVMGRPLRGSLYPRGTVLFRRAQGRYVQAGHTQRLLLEGPAGHLRTLLLHDDRKPLARWYQAQQNYARLEAEHLLLTPRREMRVTDRIRSWGWLAPPLVFVYTLLVRGCILDGWPGWLYALQRTLAEILIALELVDRRLRKQAGNRLE